MTNFRAQEFGSGHAPCKPRSQVGNYMHALHETYTPFVPCSAYFVFYLWTNRFSQNSEWTLCHCTPPFKNSLFRRPYEFAKWERH